MNNNIREEIDRLTDRLIGYAKKYYNDDAPEISDYEYDMLMNKLKGLEKQYPEFMRPILRLKGMIGIRSERF